MDYRKYYVYLKPEDFEFVKPEIKVTLNNSEEEDKIFEEKLKVIQEEERKEEEEEEEEEEDEEEEEYDEEYGDYYEMQSEKADKQAYKPSASEIDEWRQAVKAFSSRTDVKLNGRLFGDLEPVPLIEALDPVPGACFNCWQVGHFTKECPSPRAIFCINCGRRDERVITCPRCSRQQVHFFARRRAEERRRATSACRGTARSTPINDRQVTKATRVPEGSGLRADVDEVTDNGARSRIEAMSRVSRDYPQSEARTEKPEVAYLSDEELTWREAKPRDPKEYRQSFGGPEPGEIVASERPRRRRRRTRPRRRPPVQDWRDHYPPSVNTPREEKREEERREKNEAKKEPQHSPSETKSLQKVAASRETPRGTAVKECEEVAVAIETESRRFEESQKTGEAHVAQERDKTLYWAEVSRRYCEDTFTDSKIEPKKRSEEEKIPMSLDSDEYLKLLKGVDHLGSQFNRVVKRMQLSRPEIDKILAVLKEVQHYDLRMQGGITLDELLLESRESKWWKTEGSEDIIRKIRLLKKDTETRDQ